jgi:hypothetical protein
MRRARLLRQRMQGAADGHFERRISSIKADLE